MNRFHSRILVIGRNGQVARELQQCLPPLGSVLVAGRPEADLTDLDSLRRTIRTLSPEVIVNAAAYTAVDLAETEPELAMKINGEAPAVIAEEAKSLNALLVHYSSDYVFDGTKDVPYTEEDVPSPLSSYGASKLAGDRGIEAVGGSHIILRTSWVYDADGRNFLNTMMKLAKERKELRVVQDQIGAPTWSADIASATYQILVRLKEAAPETPLSQILGKRRGIYNTTANGSVSWYGFAAAILEEMRFAAVTGEKLAKLVPISTQEYPTAARRPLNSRLSNGKLRSSFGLELPDWKESLRKVLLTKLRKSTSEPGIGLEAANLSAR